MVNNDLPKLCIYLPRHNIRCLIWQKTGVCNLSGCKRVKLENLSKRAREPVFWLNFDHFLTIKTVTYISDALPYIESLHGSKFQTKSTIYWGELGRAKKPSRSSLKIMNIISKNEKMIPIVCNVYNLSFLVR